MQCSEATEAPRGNSGTKRTRGVSRREFSSVSLHRTFETRVTAAQNAFLEGDSDKAEQEATLALRIRPTAHLFALLAVIAESKAQFDRASDFRLLQAFLARDVVLWEELLHEYLSQQLYYKSVVCLQRMSAMEKDPTRYRTLQLQLADLLIGLGEIRRASNVLVPLWNSSRCRDFEVFALLSSLYFQLGKWGTLQRLIESSLKHAFHATSFTPTSASAENVGASHEGAVATPSPTEAITADDAGPIGSTSRQASRVSKRVRFFGVQDDGNDKSLDLDTSGTGSRQVPTTMSSGSLQDEFSFDESMPTTPSAASSAGSVVHQLYSTRVELRTQLDRKNFLTLLNVHAELLNEQGNFSDTIQLLHLAAACLEVDLMELPPDLLVRLGVANAFLGGEGEQPCRDIFTYLLEHCSMEEYGDVLLDAAVSLQRVGLNADARRIYTTLSRYHKFSYTNLHSRVEEAQQELLLLQGVAPAEIVHTKTQTLEEMRAEESDLQTVLAASYFGEAQCSYSLEEFDEAETQARLVLDLDSLNLQARLLLGRLFFYQRNDPDSTVALLTPRDGEPALQRIQLGAFLVHVFQKSKRYVEAIALGVYIFELIFSSEEDGDTQSVAPGTSSRRSTGSLYVPTMTRASSAIVPSSNLASMVAGTDSLFAGSSAAAVRRSHSLAASIKASTSVARLQLSRRGMESLTTTVYGASAAASLAAGWDPKEELERLKDSSTIFRFNRRRAKKSKGDLAATGTLGLLEEETTTPEQRQRRRREDVTTMKPSAFWTGGAQMGQEVAEEGEGTVSGAEEKESMAKKVKVEDEKCPEVGLEKDEDSSKPSAGTQKRVPRDELSRPLLSSATTVGEKEHDLAELEEFLITAEEVSLGDGGDEQGANSLPSVYELPSLEEVSQQFQDPAMARLFMEASSFSPGGGVKGVSGEREEKSGNSWEDATGAGGVAAATAPNDARADRVTLREAIAALGSVEFVALAVAVVDCYSALGKFTEAREFAYVSLSHFSHKRRLQQMGHSLERPLRLAVLRAALAAGESADTYRVGLRLLQEDTSEEHRREVLELMHSVLSRSQDRSSILYRAVADGYGDAAVLVLLANRYHQTRSYTRVLNLYLMALQERPMDIYLNFMVGLSYLFCSHQKRTRSREACVSAGVYYLSQYQRLRSSVDPARTGEVIYNVARAMQFLRLPHLSIPLYERVAYQLRIPENCTIALQRAARVNLYYIYLWGSGNRALALDALQSRGVESVSQ